MARIAEIVIGLTNTSRFPYAYATLDCGHAAEGVQVARNPVDVCDKCGTKRERAPGRFVPCVCGSTVFQCPDRVNPHLPEDQAVKVGDEVGACVHCVRYAESMARLRSLDASTISHARYCDRMSPTYNIYRRASDSPTGVFLEMSIAATAEVEAVLAAKRLIALSPTEGRGEYRI